MFTRESLRHGDMNDVIYDAEGTGEGRYGFMWGPIRTGMGLESRAVLARVT